MIGRQQLLHHPCRLILLRKTSLCVEVEVLFGEGIDFPVEEVYRVSIEEEEKADEGGNPNRELIATEESRVRGRSRELFQSRQEFVCR